MKLKDLNPFLRFMDQRSCRFSYKSPVVANDCRLFFVREGACRALAGGLEFQQNQFSCLMLPSGIPYELHFDEEVPAVLLVVNFDLDCDRFGLAEMMPSRPEQFDPEQLIPAAPPFDRPLLVENAHSMEALLLEMLSEHESLRPYRREVCSALLKAALLGLLRIRQGGACPQPALVREIIDYLNAHLSENITGELLSRKFHYHAYYLGKRFRQATGMSIHQYLLSLRMKACASLLLETTLSVAEIAPMVGFSSASYLSEYFRQTYGQTPSAYRKSGRML